METNQLRDDAFSRSGSEERPRAIIAIGASAGGLEALRDMLASARMPTNLAFVVIQHLDPTHESMLAQLLDRATSLDVLQCEGGERLHADRVYIIPPGRGLAIEGDTLQLTDFKKPRGLRRPIDDFFASLAADRQASAACVILSGTGADGSTGLRVIKEYGGVAVAQTPDTAKYDGMPASAIATGLVDFVKPPSEIIPCLMTFFERLSSEDQIHAAGLVADHVDDLCVALRTTVGHDFSRYKRSTFVRRVARRMHVLSLSSGKAYLNRVRSDPNECHALFRDLLINVTRFFRDPEMFDVLKVKAIEPLLRQRKDDEDLRIWVAGCSSGEEAYSLAMLFLSVARDIGVSCPLQIFATDIDEQMLQVAREGRYPASALADIPAHIAADWVIAQNEHITISSRVRDLVRFSNHNLVRDPPFSRIDLLSCRNLLIYFDDQLQQQVFPLMHYALQPKGFLYLGPSETIGRSENLFTPLDSNARIFARSDVTARYPLYLPAERPPYQRRETMSSGDRTKMGTSQEDVAMTRIAERHAPPSMIVNDDGSVLGAYGRVGRYFDFPVANAGGISAFTLARPGLKDVIGQLLRQAKQTHRRVVVKNVLVVGEFGTQPVDVICESLPDQTYLYIFRDAGPFVAALEDDLDELDTSSAHADLLEEELRITRHKLRTTIEELETANEEMMSINEELQSTNEELSTVNDELKTKIIEVTTANDDIRNFLTSTELPVIVVDRDLRIQRFTDAVRAIFPVQPADRGRRLSEVACLLKDDHYLQDATAVAHGASPIERIIQIVNSQRSYVFRALPYRTSEGVTGSVLIFTDISEALALERALAAEQERLSIAVAAGQIGIWDYDISTGTFHFDAAGKIPFSTEAAGREISLNDFIDLLETEDHAPVREALLLAATEQADLNVGLRIRAPSGEMRKLNLLAHASATRKQGRLIGALIDVTPEFVVAETRSLMLQEMNHRVRNLFAVIASLVSIGARSHSDIKSFATDVRDRIISLGRAHSLSSQGGLQSPISLIELLDTMLLSYRERTKIDLQGRNIQIPEEILTPLAMILYEWATNAAKHGVLGPREGTLQIHWFIDTTGIAIHWKEVGKDLALVPTSAGFGTQLVASSAQQIKGSITCETDAETYHLTLTFPLSVRKN